MRHDIHALVHTNSQSATQNSEACGRLAGVQSQRPRKYPASSSYAEENALMIVRGQRSGQTEVCRTASLGTWCTSV